MSHSDRLRTIVTICLGCNEADITPDAKFVDDLGADSLGVIEMIMKVEDSFRIELGDEHDVAMIGGTFGDLVALVDGKLARASA